MSFHFKIGDKVRPSGQENHIEEWPHIYDETFKVGEIISIGSDYDYGGQWWAVRWDAPNARHAYHYPSKDLLPLSVAYSEDHLKEKDVL